MYDVIVVGAGTAGCTVARKLAEQNKKVLILEKKSHIGGNCYDQTDSYGVLIHVYGPHIFHTDKEEVYQFLSRFTDWYSFRHEVVANVHGKYLPVPFNLHTLKVVYGEERGSALEEKLVLTYGMGTKVPILDLMQHRDADLQMIGKYVYFDGEFFGNSDAIGLMDEESGDVLNDAVSTGNGDLKALLEK